MTYVYKCKKCSKEFELTGSFSSLMGTEKQCPYCKSKKVIKKFFPTTFIFRNKENK